MNFQYSITYTNQSNEIESFKNFNNKKNLIQFLNANKNQLSSLKGVRINFKSISLALRDTVWKS
jgi:hypothetical protein